MPQDNIKLVTFGQFYNFFRWHFLYNKFEVISQKTLEAGWAKHESCGYSLHYN